MRVFRTMSAAMLCCSSLVAEMYLGEPNILERYKCNLLSKFGELTDSGYCIHVKSSWNSSNEYVDVIRITQDALAITCQIDTLNDKELKLRCDHKGQPVILAINKETLKANLDHLYSYTEAKALGFYDWEDVVPGGLLKIDPDSLVSSRCEMVCKKD